ncbi:MAG: hypothetical protein FJW66_01495 [Actinobacteria bacterium]|nr:hypothetical protein [Actinomycetota bacterium]
METGRIIVDTSVWKKKGTPVPLTDVLIAAIAIRNNASVLTLDKHFEKITSVSPLSLYHLE